VAHGSAKGFAEEALGLYSHSAGHTELLFELWEGGLGLPREQLSSMRARISDDGASLQRVHVPEFIHLKPQFVGALGLCEEIEVEAYKMISGGTRAALRAHAGAHALPVGTLRG